MLTRIARAMESHPDSILVQKRGAAALTRHAQAILLGIDQRLKHAADRGSHAAVSQVTGENRYG